MIPHSGAFWLLHLMCTAARIHPLFAALRAGYCNYCLHPSCHKICNCCHAAVRLALQLLQSRHYQVADSGSRDSQSLRASWPHSKYELEIFLLCLFIETWMLQPLYPPRHPLRGQSPVQTASARCLVAACVYCLLVHPLLAAAAHPPSIPVRIGPCGVLQLLTSSLLFSDYCLQGASAAATVDICCT